MSKKFFAPVLAIVFSICLTFTGCSFQSNTNPVTKSGFYFNTVISIRIYDSSKEHLLEDCFAMAERYEGYFSNTIADSDISKINAAGGEPVSVHEETIEALKKGIEYGKLSDGAFDITIGRLSDLWDISTKALLEETDRSMVPSEADIAEALATVDYRNIEINGTEVTLKNPDSRIDLGGIAKGYIADRMKAYLLENGVTSGFINLGGNVLTIGQRPDGTPFHIAIQMPFSESDTIATLQITDQTVVSSGIYERYFMADDVLYHHILDTKTGYPYDNDLLGVTIITDDSVDGDGLSTTCFSMGLEKGMELIESIPDTEAVFITSDYVLHQSSGIGTTIPMKETR